MDCPADKIVFDHERGEYICTETGEVIEERVVDQGPEWRAYTQKEKEERSRVEPTNPTLFNRGIYTVIRGNSKLKKTQLMLLTHHALIIRRANNEIERIGNLLRLPKTVREEASTIFMRAHEKGLVRGRRIEDIIAASIYAACRKMKIPITLNDIAKYTSAKKKRITKYYRFLVRKLNVAVPVVDPKKYVIIIGSRLGLGDRIILRAIELIENAREKGITGGKNPVTIAASALYVACKENNVDITQRQIAKAAQITPESIRTNYKIFLKRK